MKHVGIVAAAITVSIVACQSNACSSSAQQGARVETRFASQLSSPVKNGQFAPAPPPAPQPAAALSPPAPGLSNASSPIGTNLSAFQDWSAEWSTLDVMKQSREWISGMGGAWESKEPLELDEHGWVKRLKPGQVARTLLFWGEQPYPAGEYIVLYDGEGKLEYFQNTDVVSRAPGRDVIRLDPKKGGVGVFITATNPDDYLRNIRFLHPGGACSNDNTLWCRGDSDCGAGKCLSFEQHHEQLIFHPTFLRSLTPYSALRFMNWMETNNSRQSAWRDRPEPADARWTTKGVPVEIMVALANRMKLHPWFCIPHRADDEYVRNFASYVRDHLDPQLKAYVEHSNEVWNGMFEQHRYAAERGAQLPDKEGDRFQQQMRWHALRSLQIFEIWRKVYGQDFRRMVRVMGSWAAVPDTSKQLLTFYDAHKYTDALAIAPYFGHDVSSPDITVDEAFARVLPKELDKTREHMKGTAEVAKKFDVELIAYEGGQHLVAYGPAANDPRVNALLDAVNRDHRMKALYGRYFDMWRAVGGQLFMHYENVSAYSVHGRWGARENLLQPLEQAPKLLAIVDWSKANPRWW